MTTSKEGALCPLFSFCGMENLTARIEQWLAPKLEELDCFLVDIKVKPSGSKIEVYIDRDKGLQIETCEQVSRFLEFHLDNEADVPSNYNLEVSSPGMDNPFRVERQYRKNIGKTVEVLLHSGVKYEGVLDAYDGEQLTLGIHLPPKKKGQQPEVRSEMFLLKDIKYTKKKISF